MASEDIFINDNVSSHLSPTTSKAGETDTIQAFHASLPHYAPTPLTFLSSLSASLECNLYLKDESSRLGLPSFKILGASWGVFRALCDHLSLSAKSTSLAELRSHLATLSPGTRRPRLFAATDGNHGRAVAYIAALLDVPCTIYVPWSLPEATCALIRAEGEPRVVRSRGNYDAAVQEAATASSAEHGSAGVLVQDTAWTGYEQIPAWIVAGYGTMMAEIDVYLPETHAVVCPVGVGSLASAVVAHFKQQRPTSLIITVEPATAACLFTSLQRGSNTSVSTPGTIMSGMDCGTVSTLAYPLLSSGVDACVKVSDAEAHAALQELKQVNIKAGPCGSAALVGIKKAFKHPHLAEKLHGKNVVLLCTEGARVYDVPNSSGPSPTATTG